MAEMWYYTMEGKQMDPVTIKELKSLVGDGTLKPTDMVWKEGMARWIRASSVRELFPDPHSALDHYFTSSASAEPKPVSATATAVTAPAAGNASPAAQGASEAAESRRKSRSPGDDGRKPPRRQGETSRGGSNVGIIIGISAALVVLFLACAGGFAIIIWVAPGSAKGDPINGKKEYPVIIGPNGTDSRVFNLRGGVQYEITVTTQQRDIDVDLLVISTVDGRTVALDDGPGPDCNVRWTPRDTADFRVDVLNRSQNMRVNSSVVIRELQPQGGLAPGNKDANKDGLPPLPAGVFEGKDFKDITPAIKAGDEMVFKFRVRAGHKVNIRVVPSAQRPNIDFNLFVNRDAGDNALLASDDGPQPAASVDFVPQATEIVRVRIVNASKGANGASKAKLFYDVSP